MWNKAEAALTEALNSTGLPWTINEGGCWPDCCGVTVPIICAGLLLVVLLLGVGLGRSVE